MLMKKVVFLDRDGVINFEPGDYTFKVDSFQIIEGLFDSLRILKKRGYQFIVITNQGGISKRLYNHNDVKLVHLYMKTCFDQAKINILDIYYCPHHAVIENCICRKPNSLMIEKAIARYNVDKSKSYFIGDSRRDILAAEKAGVKGIQIKMNEPLVNYITQIK